MFYWIAFGILFAVAIVWFIVDYRKHKDDPPSGWLF